MLGNSAFAVIEISRKGSLCSVEETNPSVKILRKGWTPGPGAPRGAFETNPSVNILRKGRIPLARNLSKSLRNEPFRKNFTEGLDSLGPEPLEEPPKRTLP